MPRWLQITQKGKKRSNTKFVKQRKLVLKSLLAQLVHLAKRPIQATTKCGLPNFYYDILDFNSTGNYIYSIFIFLSNFIVFILYRNWLQLDIHEFWVYFFLFAFFFVKNKVLNHLFSQIKFQNLFCFSISKPGLIFDSIFWSNLLETSNLKHLFSPK